jgi:outer membrane protein TolC
MATAYARRPELTRFTVLKERVAVDLALATNQQLPTLTAGFAGSQDIGKNKAGSGIFAPDKSVIEGSFFFEVPLQRREARGRELVARGSMAQILAQERYARDIIAVEVQDAVSNLDRTYQRILRAKEEQKIAERVAELELQRFQKGDSNLLEVNLRELAAAGAQAKVIDAIADLYRAYADFRAALGFELEPGDL